MRSPYLRKFTSLVLILMVLSAAGLSPCPESHAADRPTACSHSGSDAATDHGPASPGDDHSTADHHAGSCFCACHLPLIVLPVELRHTPVTGKLSPVETFTALPDVYLPRFIPPQLHA